MKQHPEDQRFLKSYLLGELSQEDEQRLLEERLLTDDAFFEELLIAEDELIDDYLNNALTDEEKRRFEDHFLLTAERQQKLRFAKALKRYISTEAAQAPEVELKPSPQRLPWIKAFFTSPLRAVIAVLILTALGIGVWRIFLYQSDVSKGMLALKTAYRLQRPTEARITEFDYAPLSQTRGSEAENVDKTSRDRAERILLDAVDDEPGPSSHHALGRLYLAEHKYDRAIAQFTEALKAAPNNAQLHSDFGAALLELGRSERLNGDAGKAYENFARSMDHLNRALDLNGSLPDALFNRALLYQELMLPKQAEDDWHKYLEKDSSSRWADEARQNLKLLEQQEKRTSQSTEQLFKDFTNAYQAGDIESAWQTFTRSRARTGNLIVEKLLDEYQESAAKGQNAEADRIIQMLSFAGDIERQKTEDRFTYDLAEFYKFKASTRLRELNQARGLMKSAGEFYNRSEYAEAAKLYSEAVRLFDRAGDECEKLFSESWAGYSYLRIPDAQRSIHIFEDLSRVYESKEYKSLLAQSLHALSDGQTSLNEFSKALDYAGRALKISEQIEDTVVEIRCLQQTVSMHLTFGNYHESLNAGQRALGLAGNLSAEPKLIWPLYHEMALDLYWLGFPASALEFEKEALGLSIQSRVPFLKSRSYERMGLIYELMHNYNEAIRNGELALEEGEHIDGELSRTNILAHSALNLGQIHREAGDFRKSINYYDQALQLYGKLNLQIYLYQARKGKLLDLIALNDNTAAEEELHTVLSLFEQYRPKIIEESNRNRFFDTGQDTYDVAVNFEYSRMNDPQKALQYAETSRARSLMDLMGEGARVISVEGGPDIKLSSEVPPLQLPEIQQRLPDRAQVVEYSMLDDKLVIWVVTKNGVESRAVQIARDELSKKVLDYVHSISETTEGENSQASSSAMELYAILIDPVEPLLDKSLQVCIVPEKILNYVPFNALISPSSGKYLIEDYSLELAPSASIFISCSEQAKNKAEMNEERLLSVGNPMFDHSTFSLPDLPSAGREAEQIASYYNSKTLLTGDSATEREVKAGMKTANVIHLATHSVIDERSPMLSKFLLARDRRAGTSTDESPDGVLEAAAIYGMKLPRARLVVLSACRTGIEYSYRGEGAVGLARPFISAGVPVVVASFWPVESSSTAELMISFHKHRKQDGMPTVEALRRAQLDMIHSSEQTSQQPNTWAAFVAIGGYAHF